MIAPLYDYDKQRWTDINTTLDSLISVRGEVEIRKTHDGVLYEFDPQTEQYRPA